MSFEKKIVILAGPKGAGKTTFAREFLLREAECPIFVNADLIAGGLSLFTPNVSSARGPHHAGADQGACARSKRRSVACSTLD